MSCCLGSADTYLVTLLSSLTERTHKLREIGGLSRVMSVVDEFQDPSSVIDILPILGNPLIDAMYYSELPMSFGFSPL